MMAVPKHSKKPIEKKIAADEVDNNNSNGINGKKMNVTVLKQSRKIPPDSTVWVVFTSLLLDLLAFTMILPLMPALLDHYKIHDAPDGSYRWLEYKIKYFQQLVGAPDQFNSVLFGGILGSMFSYLQFLASPIVGSLSDVYGRRPVLLLCLVGISISYALWTVSHSFTVFILARFVGGISKGNVSLSMAVIADATTVVNRGTAMALVGIAFSVGFVIGPMIGAMFAKWAQDQTGDWFVIPAFFAFMMSIVNLLYVVLFFKESLPQKKRAKSLETSLYHASSYINISDLFNFTAVKNITQEDLSSLQTLGIVYFVYLLIYSGLEFTLTFLTHHTFKYNSMQQGYMFFGIGLVMALLQGCWVRRLPAARVKPVATLGLLLIIPSFVCVGLASGPALLLTGLLLFAVSTAMVVSCMTTLASNCGPEYQKGTILGIFRSLGALARAIGPIIASVAFWSIGSMWTYLIGAVGLVWPWYILHGSSIN